MRQLRKARQIQNIRHIAARATCWTVLGLVVLWSQPAVAQPPIAAQGGGLSSLAATGSGTSTSSSPASTVTENQPYYNDYRGEYFTSDLGQVFRVTHIAGDGQGDVPAFTHLGFTKFGWLSDGVVMFDVGARVTDEAEGGWTIGMHRRVISGDLIVGGGAYYDWQQDFQQASLAFEVFTENWTFRTNGYFVVGDKVDTDADYHTTGATNIFFQGNNILADNLLLEENSRVALNGIDMEIAHNIGRASEAFVGGYVLDGELGQNTVGVKGGGRGFLTPDVQLTCTVGHDDIFGTNIYGGVSWFIGARGGLSRPNMTRRLIVPVERNEQVAVAKVERESVVAGPIVLTNEDEPIEVVHVEAGAAGANIGTFEDPFNAMPATQDADIVYVHANGVFVNQSYTLAEDQRLLGEGAGNVHLVKTDQLDEIILPAGNGGGNRPIIQNSAGNAIVMGGGDSEVSNMEIQNAGLNGIFADGIDGFDINRNVITGSAGSGIFLNNVQREVGETGLAKGEISNNVVTNSQGDNIQLVLAADFKGEIEGNTANGSVTGNGISVVSPFIVRGEIEGNTANNNNLNGISVDISEFHGDISGNTANGNGASGLSLTFGFFRGDIEGNTTNANTDRGIDFNILGDGFTRAEIEGNTANNNGIEGIHLLFAGTGTSAVSVSNNNLSGNNGGADREFLAENEDVFGNRPVVYIDLEGNISTNALGAGPPFNYEFENKDNFADGKMFLDAENNTGTVENDDDVEDKEFPFD
jgi:hypothetical protein